MKYIKTMLFTSLLFLTACADHADVSSGISVDVVPVHYSLSLNLNKSKNAETKKRLANFLVEQKEQILSGQTEMYVATNSAYKLAKKVESQLYERGVAAPRITITRVKQAVNHRFDYVIRVTRHRVTVPICGPVQSGDFFHHNLGCTLDSIRWQSMNHPENMLNQSDMDIRPSKAL